MDFNPHHDVGAGNTAPNPQPGTGDDGLGSIPAPGALGGATGNQNGHEDSKSNPNQLPVDEDYDENSESDDEDEEYEEQDESDDDQSTAQPGSKRKRGSSNTLDADLALARQLQQQEMKAATAAGASGRRSSRASGPHGGYTESGGEYDDEQDDLSEEKEGPGRSRSRAADGSGAAGGASGGLKLKIKLPNPMSSRPPLPPAAAAPAAVQYPVRGTTPSYQQGAGGTATAATSEAGDDEEEVQYIEWDDDDAEAREEAAKKKKRMPHCLLSFDELEVMDDEVERVLGHRDVEGAVVNPRDPWASREFYVKWARYSYIHCSWDAYSTLKQLGGFKRILNYCRRMDALAAERARLSAEEREDRDVRAEMEAELEREHSQAERIAAERLITITTHPVEGEEQHMQDGGQQPQPTTTTVVQYLCKWQGLPYSEATWESAEDVERIGANHLVEDFRKREATSLEPRRGVDAARRAFATSGHRAFEKQPDYLKGEGTLRDYQLQGLNWMAYSWARGINGILADEMGLGKTVQCASMIGYLSQVQSIGGPFLIIVPLSTVPNWAREFKKWIPQINSVVYVGDAPSREVIRSFEFPLPGPATGRQFKFDALITTYELALKDAAILRNVKWSYLMVDEAHRLKNNESALYRELSQWNFKSKLLVTGTPLQNNMRELWCLLHFLHPEKFPSAEEFEANYDTKEQAGVQRLHQALGPHLLRRVIKDVEKSLPPKNERILRVPMTPLQKQYYKWILSRNFKELNKSSKGSQVTLLNIIMDLKKCCNHPFLFESARENYNTIPMEGGSAVDRLVVTSGKMVLLDKLLRRLKETGHRVLIFSQMVRVLDILSEYMTLRGFRHQRLDGSTPAHQRHQAMERFNAPGSEDFAFLLSTRAGGLGINLATADTVLLFDSDWNPQNDLQAMSRAHRIGQKDIVNIYRLVASGSVEEDILERAKRKMVLDHVVIQRMDTSGRTVLDPAGGPGGAAAARLFGKDELAAILKFGAGELFKDDDGGVPGGPPGSAGAGTSTAAAAAANPAGLMTDEDLDAILARAEVVEQREESAPGGADDLLAQFNVATFKSDDNDAAFWDRLIPEHMRPDEKPTQTDEPGIRAARLRAMEGPGNLAPDLSFRPKQKKPKAEPGPPVEGAMLRIDRWPQAVDEEGRLIAGESDPRPNGFPRTLSRRDATAFVRAVKRHGLASKLDVIANEAGVAALKQGNSKTLNALWHGLLRGCEKAVYLHAKRVRTLQAPGGGVGAAGAAAGAGSEGVVATETGGAMEATPATSMDTLQGGGGSGNQFQDGSTAFAGSAAAPLATGTAAGAGTGGLKLPADARLDFFGSDVRAADILAFTRQMALLETKLGSFAAQPDAARRLRLTIAERPAPTAWMRACGWTPEDDSALLVGIYRHGLGAWDKIADDADLRLGPKLLAARGRTDAPPELPKPSHLDTRGNGLLRQIEKVATRPPKPPKAPGGVRGPGGVLLGPGGAGTGPAGALPANIPARKEHSAAALAAFKQVAERSEAALGAEVCTLVRKLRTLQRHGMDMDTSLVVSKTKKYMNAIGNKITEVGLTQEARLELWNYVSEFTENALSGDKLEHLYLQRNLHKEGGGLSSAALLLDAGEDAGAAAGAQELKIEEDGGEAVPMAVDDENEDIDPIFDTRPVEYKYEEQPRY